MKLFDYLMMFKEDVDFDVPDTEIDNTVTVCFVKKAAEEISEDFPNMDKFVLKLLKMVDVAYLLRDGTPVCDFSKIINEHIDLFTEFVKENWSEDYQYVCEQDNIDNGEFAYQFIKEFDNVVGGRYGEGMNGKYLELLNACEYQQVIVGENK